MKIDLEAIRERAHGLPYSSNSEDALACAKDVLTLLQLVDDLRAQLQQAQSEIERLKQTVTLCGNCGVRFLSPKQDAEHGLDVCVWKG